MILFKGKFVILFDFVLIRERDRKEKYIWKWMKRERICNANVINRTEVYWISIQIVNIKNIESRNESENQTKVE